MSLKYNINVEENELNGNSDESKYNEKERGIKATENLVSGNRDEIGIERERGSVKSNKNIKNQKEVKLKHRKENSRIMRK